MSKLVARVGIPALAVLVLAGCGSSGSSTGSTASTTTTAPSSLDATIAAQVPAAIKAKGKLIVAADAQYAPNEFIASDGHTVIGMDADLAKALGEVLGLKVERRQRQLRSDHPRPRGRQATTSACRRSPTPRHARRSSTSSTTSAPGPRSSRSPQPTRASPKSADLCGKTTAGREGHDRAGGSRSAEQEVHQGRQEGRQRARLHRPERGQPRPLQRPRAGRHGRLAGRRLPGQAVRTASSSSSARATRSPHTASRSRRRSGMTSRSSRRSRS